MDKGKYVEERCRAMIREFEQKKHFALDEGVKAIKDLYDVKEECNCTMNIGSTIDNVINDIANKICIGVVAASIFKYKKIRDKITIDKDNVIWYDGFERVGIACGIKNVTQKKVNDIEEILIEKNNGKSIRINDKAFVLGWE